MLYAIVLVIGMAFGYYCGNAKIRQKISNMIARRKPDPPVKYEDVTFKEHCKKETK